MTPESTQTPDQAADAGAMRWASAGSNAPIFADAVAEVIESIEGALDTEPTALFAYLSPAHRESYLRLPPALAQRFPTATLLGCSGGGVIGGGREIEREPGISLTAAALPGVELRAFHISSEELTRWAEDNADVPAAIGASPDETRGLVLHPEPFSCNTRVLLESLDRHYPDTPKIGGIASGGNRPGHNALYTGWSTFGNGVTGLALLGDIELDTVVAQGCRPVGSPLFVTRCDRNVILELDGRRPAAVVQELYAQLGERDQKLMRDSLFLGVVADPQTASYTRGDFLVRNIIGFDASTAALGVDALISRGAVVQLHVRDAAASAEDLAGHLDRYATRAGERTPEGALLYSCMGRGVHLYGRPNHDSEALHERLGAIPLGGFFCGGEIGPVRGVTHIHGYTSAFGLFRRRRAG